MLLWFMLFTSAKAGHISGSSITYSCVNSCTIRVEFRVYRDCSSPINNVSPIGTVFIEADSGCVPPTPVSNWANLSNIEVTPVCPGTPTQCNTPGAAIPGVMEHYWVREYDFCASNCPEYTIYFGTCCRSANINTLFLPASQGLYTFTTINPLLTPCNSSPSFNNPPTAYICENQAYTLSQAATDVDGDSLTYTLGPCLQYTTQGNVQGVTYLGWINANQPLGNDWIVSLDTTSGDLHFVPNSLSSTPGSIQVGVLCVYVTEWRNGVAISTIERDIQINVIPCPPNVQPIVTGPQGVIGGSVNGFTLTTCVGAQLCADFRAIDPDMGQSQYVWWDQSLASLGATFTSTINPAIMDTVTGNNPSVRFCWAPTVPGTYTFGVTVRDDACPTYGQNQYTFTVVVGQIGTAANHVVSGCQAVQLCAEPLSGLAPFSYVWTGTGGLSGNPNVGDSCLHHAFPQQGQFPLQLTVTDAWGCTASYLDTVTILNNVNADAGPDTATCSSQPIVIGGPPQTNPDLQYAWSPFVHLGNPFIPQPTATIANGGSNPAVYPFVLTLRDTVTECMDKDTMLLTVYPIPESPFVAPDTVCSFAPIALIYTGSNPAYADYSWTVSNGYPPTLTGQGPHQAYWTTPGLHEVSLTVTQNGCPSPVERDTIYVVPRPDPQIGPIVDQCLAGNNFAFQSLGNHSGNASYYWQFWPNANPPSSSSVNPNGIVFTTPGIKRVILQVIDNGCFGSVDTAYFQVFADPNPNWMHIGGIQCFQGNYYAFQTTGINSPNASYSWTFQDGIPSSSTTQNPQISFSSPGPKVVTLTVVDNGCTASRTDTVWIFPEPAVLASADTAFCAGEGGVQLQAIAHGGTAPYYYSWSCNAPICGIDSLYDNDPHVNPTSSAWYYVYVTDANGCESLWDSVWVEVLPKPIANAGPDRYLCGADAPCEVLTPTVTGSPGPFTYQWLPFNGLNSTGIPNPCARPDTTTIYALVVTDLSTGCSSDYTTTDTLSTVIVHVYPVPVAQAGHDQDICPGDTTILAGSGSGAGPLYTYSWSPSYGLSNPNIPNPKADPPMTYTYSLTVWSNGCPSLADTVQVRVHVNPSIDAGWDREICFGESAMLDATAAGDSTASYTYVWTQPLGLSSPYVEDPLATPQLTTTYYVTAMTNWGCYSSMDSVTVRIRPTPMADAGDAVQLCEGDSVRLGGGYHYPTPDSVPQGSQIQYSWTPALNLSDSGIPQPMAIPHQSTLYHFTVSYGVCETHDSVLVTVVPDLQTLVDSDTSVICAGDSVQLHAYGGLGNPAYQWVPAVGLDDPHVASPWASPMQSVDYRLYMEEAGCADSAWLRVEVLPRPAAAFLHSALEGCAPLEVSFLDNSSSYGFRVWDFGDGSAPSNMADPLHVYSEPGTYYVSLEVADSGYCVGRSEPVTVVVAPSAEIVPVTVPELPVMLYLPQPELAVSELGVGNVRWVWDFGDGHVESTEGASHVYRAEGTYFVHVRAWNAGGCMAERVLGPIVVLPPELEIPNVFSPNADGINDAFLVRYEGHERFQLEIVDRWGVRLYNSLDKLEGWDGKAKGGAVAPDGTYFYVLRIGDRVYNGSLTLLR